MNESTKVNEVVITHEENGTFTLKTDAGEIIKYDDKHLIYALEETVYKFRGRKPKLTVSNTDQYASSSNMKVANQPYSTPMKASAYGDGSLGQRQSSPNPHQNNMSHDEIASARFNGGLGGRVPPTENWNGFGSVQ
jgi:hypothetical protein